MQARIDPLLLPALRALAEKERNTLTRIINRILKAGLEVSNPTPEASV